MQSFPQGYDVIGDVHGMADKLHALLARLGYSCKQGVWQHPQRQALFIGDLIDNGLQTEAVLTTVKDMVDAGKAQVVMGNHELNAVGYATRHSVTGEYLREHNDANTAHHQAFLDNLPTPEQRAPWLEWFKTLPIYLDFGNVRFIHACWHEPSFEVIQPYLNADNSLKVDSWEAVFEEDSAPFNAIENLLKGIEVELPDGMSFLDHKGKRRYSTRISWWLQSAGNMEEMVHIPTPSVNADVLQQLARMPANKELLQASCYQGNCPVFFGHYWLKAPPKILHGKAACTDFSAGKDGPLVAYRWSGEQELSNQNFVTSRD